MSAQGQVNSFSSSSLVCLIFISYFSSFYFFPKTEHSSNNSNPQNRFTLASQTPFARSRTRLISPFVSPSPLPAMLIQDLQFFLEIAHSASSPGFCTNSEGLSQDQVAILHLYTQESPFYSFINGLLRERNREHLRHLFPVLKIMLTALSSLPKEPITVYRGVKANLVSQFPVEKKFVWWSITSTSASLGTLQSPQFLGSSGERTLFAIKMKSAGLLFFVFWFLDFDFKILVFGFWFLGYFLLEWDFSFFVSHLFYHSFIFIF